MTTSHCWLHGNRPCSPPVTSPENPLLPPFTPPPPLTSQQSTSADNPNSKRFPDLPAELRLKIWGLAVPDPRLIPDGITFFTNLNLACPRAILPSKHEWAAFWHESLYDRYAYYHPEEDFESNLDAKDVMTLLHTCSESRHAVLQTFRLNCESTLPGESDPLFNPSEDLVYIPYVDERHSFLGVLPFLLENRTKPIQCLSQAHHVALRIDHHSLNTLDAISSPQDPDDLDDLDEPAVASNAAIQGWHAAFPNLQSLYLFVDPGDSSDFNDGTLRLYESENVPIMQLRARSPSQVIGCVKEQFIPHGETWETVSEDQRPEIELFVITRRPPR